jgi:hypothetical protein
LGPMMMGDPHHCALLWLSLIFTKIIYYICSCLLVIEIKLANEK